jgi:hypothetical protein
MEFDKLKNSTNSNITIHILSKKVIALKCFIANAQESKKVKPFDTISNGLDHNS